MVRAVRPFLRLQREARTRAINRARLARQPLWQIRPGVKLHPRLIGIKSHPPPRGRINRHHRRPRTATQAKVVIKAAQRHRRIQRPQIPEIKRRLVTSTAAPSAQQRRRINRQIAIRRNLQHLPIRRTAALPRFIRFAADQINHATRRSPAPPSRCATAPAR